MTNDYQLQAAEIAKGIRSMAAKAKANLHLRQFWITIANMRNLLPEWIEQHDRETIFLDYLCGKTLAALDQQILERIEDVRVSGSFLAPLVEKDSPKVFCGYHLGSFRAIIGYLAYLGFDFSLVVNKDVYQNQAKEIQQTVSGLNTKAGKSSKLNIICADDLDAAYQMVRAMRNGHSLVVYADGNTGVGGAFRQDEKMQQVSFLNQKIAVRQGIPYLAHLLKIPIIPVISFRDAAYEIVLHFLPPIIAKKGESKQDFCKTTMQTLFGYLEQWLRRYPLQWEGWGYIHRQLIIQEKKRTELQKRNPHYSDLKFNDQEFGLFIYGEDRCLMDLQTYQTHLLSQEAFNLLRSYWNMDGKSISQKPALSSEMLEYLCNQRYLIS